MDSAIALFVRHPTPGKVKTRLAAGIGDRAAAEFYAECAQHAVEQATQAKADCFIFFSAAEEECLVKEWLAPYHSRIKGFIPQVQDASGNLGVRLAGCMHNIMCSYNFHYKRVLIVGTDIPDVDSVILNKALHTLRNFQVVFGPAKDGGYYLVGLSLPTAQSKSSDTVEPLVEFFSEIPWSTEMVLTKNVSNAEKLGLSVAPVTLLPILQDIDTVQDLREWSEAGNVSRQFLRALTERLFK